MRRLSALPVVALTALVLTALVGCQSAAPGATPTPAPASEAPTTAPAPDLSPGVTLDGSTVTVVGQGRSQSDPFELPAGSATMTITACRSNQVMPFITLVDGTGQSAGLIVDPVKTLTLAGGTYTVSAQANPDCVWRVAITPE